MTITRRKLRTSSTLGWVKAAVISIIVYIVLVVHVLSPSAVYADAPAITDFGQSSLSSAIATQDNTRRHAALFVTLYPDGRGQIRVLPIHDDTLTSFAGEHPAWRLDQGLMWFLQMPVYIRQLDSEHVAHESNSV